MVRVGRVDPDVVVVVVRVRLQVVHLGPRGARVARAEHAAVPALERIGDPAIHLDRGVDDLGILGGYGESDATESVGRQAIAACGIGELGPRLPTVGRLVDPASLPDPLHVAAAPAQPVPGGGVEDLGIRGVHLEVDEAGRVVHEQDPAPRLAPVGGLVDAALGVRAPEVAEGRDVHDLGVGRVDHHAADRARVLQAHVRPLRAAVGGLVDAVAPPLRAQAVLLPRPHPHDVRIGRRHRDVADGLDAEAFRHRLPRNPAVGSLPHAAAGCADVERLRRPSRVGHRERGHPPAVRGGAEVAEREALEEPREGVLGGGRAVRAACGGVGGRRGRRPFRPRLLCDEGGGGGAEQHGRCESDDAARVAMHGDGGWGRRDSTPSRRRRPQASGRGFGSGVGWADPSGSL